MVGTRRWTCSSPRTSGIRPVTGQRFIFDLEDRRIRAENEAATPPAPDPGTWSTSALPTGDRLRSELSEC